MLLGKPPLDLLELGENRGLALAGLGGLLPLFAELLLGFLELALLGLYRIVSLLSGGWLARRHDRDHENAENGPGARRRRSDDRDVRGCTSQGGATEPTPQMGRCRHSGHRSRPRAIQPPTPPSSVPVISSAPRASAGRNSSRGSPTVRSSNGSISGAAKRQAATRSPRARQAPKNPCTMPCRSRGSRTALSDAPTSRMISVSCRRAWRTSVVAVVTVRMAASASSAPTPSPA